MTAQFKLAKTAYVDDLEVRVNERIENLEENKITGVEVYSTLADLPETGTLLVSYKVSNDPISSNNGYYHWNGSNYVKDFVSSEFAEISDKFANLEAFTVDIFENLFDKTTIADGYYLSSGVLTPNSGYYTSNYIPVESSSNYISNKIFSFISFFNNTYAHINTIALAGQTLISTPANAAYIRISYTDAIDFNSIMVESGTISHSYVEFGEKRYSDKYALKSDFDTIGLSQTVSPSFGDAISNPASNFIESDYSLIITCENSACENSGILNTIQIKVSNAGTVRFLVGLLDQRNAIVKSAEFTFAVSSGINNLSVKHLNISIGAGEQLFAQISYDSTAKIQWLNNASYNANQFLYGSETGYLHRLETTFGGGIRLNYTVTEIDSIFAQKGELAIINNEISQLQSKSNTIGLIYDRSGNPYRQIVINGSIELIPLNYEKVLVLGNSLTIHGEDAGIGYYGDGWPMCASTEETGWVKQFERILQQKKPLAEVIPFSIYAWELDYLNVDLSALLDSVLTSDLDCVIFRAGENGTNTDNYETGVDRLISYILDFKPNIDIIMTSMFWHNATKETAILNVANKYGLTYIYTADVGSNRCRLGDYTLGSDENYHPIINSGVAAHTNDIGFLQFANILASAFNYDELSDLYNISVIDAESIGYICFDTWVAGGIFNIQTSATTVTASWSGGVLSVTNRGGGVFTFLMPPGDATVTIST